MQHVRSIGLGYKWCAVIPVTGQQTNGPTFQVKKVTQSNSPDGRTGAESAIYDCLVMCATDFSALFHCFDTVSCVAEMTIKTCAADLRIFSSITTLCCKRKYTTKTPPIILIVVVGFQ